MSRGLEPQGHTSLYSAGDISYHSTTTVIITAAELRWTPEGLLVLPHYINIMIQHNDHDPMQLSILASGRSHLTTIMDCRFKWRCYWALLNLIYKKHQQYSSTVSKVTFTNVHAQYV